MKAPRFLTVLFLLGALSFTVQAQTFSIVYNLGNSPGDPFNPYAPGLVVQGVNGNLYSTAPTGGTSGNGAVFEVTPSGNFKTLYELDRTHGEYPFSGLTLANDKSFYGTTVFGGSGTDGVIFRMTPQGNLTILHNFNGTLDNTDGADPYAPPIQGLDGTFYGTTFEGGTFGFGAIYNMSQTGTFALLHSFNISDGSYPQGGVIQASDGNFYGTTREGGTGPGTVYKLTRSGSFSTLYMFDLVHGQQPAAGLLEGSDGNLYGTTTGGGLNGLGVIYKITRTGTLTVVHDFSMVDGTSPYSGLVEGTDRKFYGTTNSGGNLGFGTIYRLSASGQFSVLYNFDGIVAATPEIVPTQHTNGILYGDTEAGGSFGDGTVYSFNVSARPFVRTVISAAKVGQKVLILGQGFAGVFQVFFSGTSARFSAPSDTCLEAIVPNGAASGLVTVVTANGSLKSNRPFRILP